MKKRIICLILILIVAVGGGIGAYILNEANKGPAEIVESEAKFKTTLKEAPTDGSLPEAYSVYDNVAFALWKIENTDEFKTVTTGKSEASIATIQIYNTRTVKNGRAIVSTVSAGMVSSGKQKYFVDNKVLLRDASKINGFDTIWKTDQPECISNKAYINRYGWLPYQCTGYIICEDTILEASELIQNGDGTYTIRLVLNPDSDYAPFWYRREVLTNAGSTMVPEFRSIEIEYKLDTQWRILESRIQEEYKVKSMGVEAVSKTDCTEVFTYDSIEFDENEYNFFRQYESLVPAEGEETPKVEDDVLTMITSSLQTADGSDKNLSLAIQLGETKISGQASLNISDLQNVKVRVQLEGLYLEYSDALYLSLGGLKLRAEADSLAEAVAMIAGAVSSEGTGTMSFDLAEIMDALTGAEVIRSEDGSDIQIRAVLNLMGLELPLYFHFAKTDGVYSVLSISADIQLKDISLSVNLTESDLGVAEADKTEFSEFANLEFILEELADILASKKLTADINLSYDQLEIAAQAKADFTQMKLDCIMEIKYKSLAETIRLTCTEDTLYLNYETIYVKISYDDLKAMLKKYAGLDLDTPSLTLDLTTVISTVFAIDYNQLLKDIAISENQFSLTVGLSQFAEAMSDLQLSFAKEMGLDITAVYDRLSASIRLAAGMDGDIVIEEDLYQNLGYLDFIIDNVLAVYNAKKAAVSLTANYQGIEISLDGQVDFTADLRLYAGIAIANGEKRQELAVSIFDGVIYLDFAGLKLKVLPATLKALLNKLGVSLSESEVNLNTILDIVLTIDYKKLLKELTILEDSTSIVLGMEQFAEDMEDIALVFRRLDSGLGISSNLFQLTGTISCDTDVDIHVEDSEYQSLERLSYLFDEIFTIVENKALSVEFSGYQDKISLSGIAKVDFTSGIRAVVDIQASYNGIELPLVIHYLDTYTQGTEILQNVILINFKNIYAYITVEDLKQFMPDSPLNPADFSLDDLLKTILSIDFARLIEGVVLEEGNTSVDINLSQFNLDLKDFLDTTKTISVAISKIDGGLNLSIAELFHLNLRLYHSYDGEITGDSSKTYVDLANMIDYAVILGSLIGKESIAITIDGKINLGGFIASDGSAVVAELKDTWIDLILVDGAYQVDGHMTLLCAGVQAEVSFKFIGYDLYVSLGGIHLKLDITQLDTLIEEISSLFAEDAAKAVEAESFGSEKINELLASIVLVDDSTITLSLESLLKQLPKLTILLSKIAGDGLQFDISAGNAEEALIELAITAVKTNRKEIGALPAEYLTENDILTLCGYVKDIMDLLERKAFTLSFGSKTSPIEIIRDKKIIYKLYGSLALQTDVHDKLNLQLKLRIEEYDGKLTVSTHDLSVIVKDGMMYAVYGNSDADTEVLKVKTTLDNILGMVATIAKVSGLDFSALEEYLDIYAYLNPELENVDFTQLRNLLASLLSFGDNDTDSQEKNFDISSLLHALTISDNEVILQLSESVLLPGIPENEYLTIRLSKNQNALPQLSIDKLYISYESMDKHEAIRNLSLSLDGSPVVEAPESTDDYYDISELGDLVDGVLTTATFTDFHIQGTITLKALSIINVNVPLNLYVKVDETGDFKVYAYLDMTNIGLGSLLISKKQIYIVYDSGYVYINRVDNKSANSKKIKITYETFLSDISYYLLDFAMGMPDSIMELINGSSSEDSSINASKVITEYGYAEDTAQRTKTFSFGLDMAELTGNSDLGVLKAALELSPVVVSEKDGMIYEAYALSAVKNFNFNMVDVIDISCSSLTIANITEQDGYRYIGSVVLENQDLYTYINGYIQNNFCLSDGTAMEVDTIYDASGNAVGKCSHSVFFYQGGGTDLDGNELTTITVKDEAGKSFAIPEPSTLYRLYQNRQYYFAGWYLDQECTIPFTEEDAFIQTMNTHAYAKWVEMYNYTVIDANGPGLKETLKAGEETSGYTADTSKGDFLGFYNFETDELITAEPTLLPQAMPAYDLTVYAKWENMTYLVVDNKYEYALTNAEDGTPVSGLVNERYQIYSDGRYYTYSAEAITSKLLLTQYADCIVSVTEGRMTTSYIYIESYNAVRTGYTTVELDFESDLYTDEAGNRLYTAVTLKNDELLLAKELPYGYYSSYEINAWVDENGRYYSLQEDSAVSGKMTAYITTNRNYFTYDGNEITGFDAAYAEQTSAITVLITPRYGINQEIVTSIGTGAFSGNSVLQTVVLSEGIEAVNSDAFKNGSALKKVYFADTVVSVAKDSFYMNISGNNYEANRDIAVNIRFYLSADSALDTSSWLACKWNSTEKYYGKKYSVFGSGDFTSVFQVRTEALAEIVKNLL